MQEIGIGDKVLLDQRGCKRCKSHWRQSVGIREAVNDARAIGDKVLGSERL